MCYNLLERKIYMLFNQSVKTIKKNKKSMTKIDCFSVSSKQILFKKDKYNIIKRILHLDPCTGFYRYSSLKHDETGSTYYTKFYNKNGVDMEFFALPFEEAYNDISSMIANLQITPDAPRAVSIKALNELVLQDMEKHPQLKKQ